MVLKFACADFAFPLLSHRNALDVITMLEFEGVDIGLFHDRSHLQPLDMFEDIPANAAKLRKDLQERHLAPADVFLQTAVDFESTAVNNPDKEIRDFARAMFEKCLAFAEHIGAEHMTILPGVHFTQESLEDSIARSSDELRWRVERAAKAGIVLAVEPHLGSFAEDPEAAADLVKRTPGLTLTLDYTHFTKNAIPDERVETLMPYASHFHARAACPGKAQTTLTRNTIDYERVVEKMHESAYQGYVGIEYVWIDWEGMNEVDNISETIRLKSLIAAHASGLE